MKTLISVLFCSALVGVYCRPAEPEFRDFGVQPDNPNVKVFFTYPTASPLVRKDNPNDLEKGTQNDEKEKYVKDDVQEEAITKGEVIGKTENEAPVTEEETNSTTEGTVVEGDQPPPSLLFVVNSESSDNKEEASNDENEEDSRPLSKDIASQSSPSDNRLEAALNDTLNGDDDTELSPDAEINDEEAVEENREFVASPLPVAEFSDADENNSPSVGFTVNPASAALEEDLLNAEEAEAVEEMEGGPIVIAEAANSDSGVPLIPAGTKILLPVAETEVTAVENEPLMVSELGNEPDVVLVEMGDVVPEPIMAPIGEIHTGDPSDVMVEAMPNDNLSNDSTMMKKEVFQITDEEGLPMRVEAVVPAENEESLPIRVEEFTPMEEEEEILPIAEVVHPMEARGEDTISPISELPAPIAEFAPMANAPIAEADQAFMMTREEVEPKIEMTEDFADYMGAADDEVMEAELGVAPQMPDSVLPIVEAEVPLMDETVLVVGDDAVEDSRLDSTVAEPKESDDRTPRTEEKIVDGKTTVTETTTSSLKEVDPVVALVTKEIFPENNKLANVSIPAETATDAALEATLDEAEDTNIEGTHKETTALNEERKAHKEDRLGSSNMSETVTIETEAPEAVPVTTETSVDPIELALQNEDFSDDDTFLNETL